MHDKVVTQFSTTAASDLYKGERAELTFDYQLKQLSVHDGVTVGGFRIPTENTSVIITIKASSEPSAPEDGCVIFVRVNAGKHQLCVKFPTGGIQIIATEP